MDTALVLGSFIGCYHQMVERHSRISVVPGSLTVIICGARAVVLALLAREYHALVQHHPAPA